MGRIHLSSQEYHIRPASASAFPTLPCHFLSRQKCPHPNQNAQLIRLRPLHLCQLPPPQRCRNPLRRPLSRSNRLGEITTQRPNSGGRCVWCSRSRSRELSQQRHQSDIEYKDTMSSAVNIREYGHNHL